MTLYRPPPIAFSAVAKSHCRKGDGQWPTYTATAGMGHGQWLSLVTVSFFPFQIEIQ